jgi:peptide/nickel transport system substrate-binding protein
MDEGPGSAPCECCEGGLSREELLRRAAVGGAALAGTALLAGRVSAAPAAARPQRGGRLRVGFVGGGSAESLDPGGGNTIIDLARTTVLYEKLFDLTAVPDKKLPGGGKLAVVPTLAESIEHNAKGDVWTIRLKEGVEFHNGKTLSPEDVIYTFQRTLDAKNALGGRTGISFVDPRGMKKLDERTVRMRFVTPIADPESSFASRFMGIIPEGTKDFRKPVGTGAFKFVSWKAGDRSLFAKFANYRINGLPYLDELEYIDIPDDSARLNALRSGQVDAIENIAPVQARALSRDATVKILNCRTGGMVPMITTTTLAPFDDVRVRQAFRLLVDRPQMIQNVLLGFGFVGNDLYSPFDPLYASDLPQRKYDPEKAKSLLKAAGKEGLKVTLWSAKAGPGMLESAQAFAEQAKAGGITVTVNNGPADTYFSDKYDKVPFFQTLWGNYPLDNMISLSTYSKAAFNEPRFHDKKFDALWLKARGTLNEAKRRQLYHDVQKILYDSGGYIIWGFSNYIDGYRSNVQGLQCSPIRPLGFFNFKQVWLT